MLRKKKKNLKCFSRRGITVIFISRRFISVRKATRVSRITLECARLLFNFLRVSQCRVSRPLVRQCVHTRRCKLARELRMMYRGRPRDQMDPVQNFRFSRSLGDPLVGDHLDGRYVSAAKSLPHIPFSEGIAPRERYADAYRSHFFFPFFFGRSWYL